MAIFSKAEPKIFNSIRTRDDGIFKWPYEMCTNLSNFRRLVAPSPRKEQILDINRRLKAYILDIGLKLVSRKVCIVSFDMTIIKIFSLSFSAEALR